ncbi:MAG: DNA gyrase inhibitor YacG [Pyrinomonadaceae bacterium MAG19_C2-C3]|nr:DNA gyrase inhibitor YacG [Pyrinomonadaceae bacterium MAG19_C2-C3]
MKCLTCKKPIQWQDNPFRPFCSERCRMIDFGHWVDEDYAVPSNEAADFFDDDIKEQSREDARPSLSSPRAFE